MLNVSVQSVQILQLIFLTSYEQKLFLTDFVTNTCTNSGSDTYIKDGSCPSPTNDNDNYQSTSDSTDLESDITQNDDEKTGIRRKMENGS